LFDLFLVDLRTDEGALAKRWEIVIGDFKLVYPADLPLFAYGDI